MPDRRKMNFYEDFYRSGKALPDAERGEFYAAILDYFFEGVEPDGGGYIGAMFELVRDRLDISKKNSASGSKGGCASVARRACAADSRGASGGASSAASSAACDSHRREGEGDREKKDLPCGRSKEGPARLEPPTVDEVREYALASTMPDDAEAFVDHYASQGWVKGNGLPATDWRRLYRGWVGKMGEFRERRKGGGDARARPDPGEFAEYA